MLVCKECNNSINAVDENAKKICPICQSYEFIEKLIDDDNPPTWSHCGRKCNKETSDYKSPPFYNSSNNTFYCGCWGWD